MADQDFTKTARALSEVPLAKMVEQAATGIAEAQAVLDQKSLEIALEMAKPENGIEVGGEKRSLLDLGFTPTFYQFSKVTITLQVDITIAESEDFNFDFSLSGAVGSDAVKDKIKAQDTKNKKPDDEEAKTPEAGEPAAEEAA